MSNNEKVQIYGKTYTVKNITPHINAQELAHYVDSCMNELSKKGAKSTTIDLAILTALNIAQELKELQHQIEVGVYRKNKDVDAWEGRLKLLVQTLSREVKQLKSGKG